jgi:hypothetical protein
MSDALAIVATVAFFVLAAVYTHGCDKLRKP